MKLKIFIIIILGLVVTTAIFWFEKKSSEPSFAPLEVGAPVVDMDMIREAKKIMVKTHMTAPEYFALVREDSGHWFVPGYHGILASYAQMQQLVERLLKSEVIRFIEDPTPEELERYNIGETGVSFHDKEGHVIQKIEFGGQVAVEEGSSAEYLARINDDSRIAVITVRPFLNGDIDKWGSTKLFNFIDEDVAELLWRPQPSGKEYLFKRTSSEEPLTLVGQGAFIDPKALTVLVQNLTRIRFEALTPKGDSRAQASLESAHSYQLKTFDGREANIALGRIPEDLKIPIVQEIPIGLDTVENLPVGDVESYINVEMESTEWNHILERFYFSLPVYLYVTLAPEEEKLVLGKVQ
ncbi:DUF4340 domain-containing protein [Rubellicoccus peritrichatus]|uniref:DUF4340 domain-containing protein n=1 Tax=Rubellicoccus peritrichatus TaxID=3080537 RepID=A0AAQ3QVP2_9BACT|nr:DUF4340 domain-containing protein [Puniceicoccus sp. CR14]WOO43576.1 DUF4340 domain-containing protein [Puniceicoccus sp. CR14]